MVDGEEGSVFVEGVDDDGSEGSSEEQSQESSQEQGSEGAQGNEGEQQDGKDSTLENKDGQEQDQKTELTEKGTKLDKDPLSAANQLLANERAKAARYEKFLSDPVAMRKYLAEIDKDGKKEETEEEPLMREEDIQTKEDLHKFLAQRETKHQKDIEELRGKLTGVTSAQRDSAVATTIQSDISAVRSQYSELDPKPDKDGKPTNPTYNPVLDNAVGALYEFVDFDKENKSFRGNVSIRQCADFVMQVVNVAKKQGSQDAQTEIRDKRTGRAVSGSSKAAPDETKMSASELIASRVRRAMGN